MTPVKLIKPVRSIIYSSHNFTVFLTVRGEQNNPVAGARIAARGDRGEGRHRSRAYRGAAAPGDVVTRGGSRKMYYGLGAPLPRKTGRGSYRRRRSELWGLAPRLRLPGNLGCFGSGPLFKFSGSSEGALRVF